MSNNPWGPPSEGAGQSSGLPTGSQQGDRQQDRPAPGQQYSQAYAPYPQYGQAPHYDQAQQYGQSQQYARPAQWGQDPYGQPVQGGPGGTYAQAGQQWADPYAQRAQAGWQSSTPQQPWGPPQQQYPSGIAPQQQPPATVGRTGGSSVLRQTPVTCSIIAICLVVWLLELVSPTFYDAITLYPYQGRTEPWRFLTSAFAHSKNPAHILFNMYALWTCRQLELFFGRARFAGVYLLSALAGGVTYVALASPADPQLSWYTGVVGASGAIFGLFGAMIPALRHVKASTSQMWVVVAINMLLSFSISGIAWQAHVGGFLAGGAAGWLLVRESRATQRTGQDRSWWWLAGLIALVVVVGIVKYAVTPTTLAIP